MTAPSAFASIAASFPAVGEYAYRRRADLRLPPEAGSLAYPIGSIVLYTGNDREAESMYLIVLDNYKASNVGTGTYMVGFEDGLYTEVRASRLVLILPPATKVSAVIEESAPSTKDVLLSILGGEGSEVGESGYAVTSIDTVIDSLGINRIRANVVNREGKKFVYTLSVTDIDRF